MNKIFCAGLILFLFPAVCLAGSTAKKEVKRGNLLYNKGEFEEALKKYKQAIADSPDSDIVNFDLGAALYKTQSYQAAAGHFEKSLLTEDQSLEQKASYNTGNAEYKYGISKEDTDLAEAVNLLKQSLHHYQRAIELDPEDKDAKHNYEFVKKELERLQKKLKQQQQKQQEQQKQQQQKEEKEKEKRQESKSEKDQQKEEEKKEREKEGEKSSQQEQDEREQKKEEKPEQPEPKKDEQPEQQKKEKKQRAGVEPEGEMSENEASTLLENYRREEEPKGLYKEKIPTGGMPEVLKDW